MVFTENLTHVLIKYETELIFVCVLTALILSAFTEALRPRRAQSKKALVHRWPTNFGLLVVDQLNVTGATVLAAVFVSWWNAEQNFGLASYFGLGFWVSVPLAFLVFELISYWFHRALHAFPMLWRIHAIHHSDSEVDFSTTFRNHPLELLVIAPVTVPIVALLGFPLAVVVAYQMIRTTILVFAHSNILLPERVDRILRILITTPDYHRSHHSSDRAYTDSNYSPVFPIYDYIFGTYRKKEYAELAHMNLGLEYMGVSNTRIHKLLLTPFMWKKYFPESASIRPESAVP